MNFAATEVKSCHIGNIAIDQAVLEQESVRLSSLVTHILKIT
jgi:hypothetical protein